MAVNDVYKASVIFTSPNAAGEMEFNLHYRTTTVNVPISDSAEALDIAANMSAILQAEYFPVLPDVITLQRIDVVGISDPLVGVSFAVGVVGGDAGDVASFRNAPVMKLGTGLRGRSYNGRAYLMAPVDSRAENGVLTATYVNTTQDTFAALQVITAATSTNEYSLTIYSPTLSAGGPVLDNLVTSWDMNPKCGSQRSRQDVT